MSTTSEQLRQKIRGPVYPIVMPFRENEDVDYDALADYASYLIEQGAKTLLMTVGTSRFNLLSHEEMKKANATLAQATAGRATAIAAGPGPNSGCTRSNIEFANEALEAGADGILLLYPERWYGDEPIVEFFHTVADNTDLPVLIHAVPMRDGFGGVKALKPFSVEMLERVAEHPSIAGIKEENGDRNLFDAIHARFHKELPLIGAGGAMRRFMGDYKLGSTTYLVGLGSFRPALSEEFYQKLTSGDETGAAAIAEKYEDPFFHFAVQLGWHRCLKETLAQLGLMLPHERAPFNRISQEERFELRDVLKKIGWLES